MLESFRVHATVDLLACTRSAGLRIGSQLLLFGVLLASPGWARVEAQSQGLQNRLVQTNTSFAVLCPVEVVTIKHVWVEVPPIPVGCELIDCCPGCPGPGPLDWRIQVEGTDLIGKVGLRFHSLSAEGRRSLDLGGSARWDDQGVLWMPTSSARIGGLPQNAERPVTAELLVELNERAVEAAFPPSDPEARTQRAFLHVAQKHGRYVVSDYFVVIDLKPCKKPVAGSDVVDLENNIGGDEACLIVDGQKSSCRNDERFDGDGVVPVGKFQHTSNCREDLIVFSEQNAMAWPTPTWTNNLDVFPVTLDPILQVPVSVWIIGPRPAAQAWAAADVLRANQLFDEQKVGIQFVATYSDATGNPQAGDFNLGLACTNAGDLAAQIGFTPNALNVYYATSLSESARGRWCGASVILVGSSADNETLAHEFGHALGLGHTNNLDIEGDGTANFSAQNLMQTGGVNRDHLTLGQAFRCNVLDGSVINSMGIRTGPTLTSCPNAGDKACPALDLQ